MFNFKTSATGKVQQIIYRSFLSFSSHFLSFVFFPTEAKAIILGQSDLYVKMGSKVILTCVISQGPHDLGTISWYRGELFTGTRLHTHQFWFYQLSDIFAKFAFEKRFDTDQSNST